MPSGDDGFCTGTPLVAAAPGLLVLVVQDYDAGT
ncbi:hypothetical protein FHR84_000781 [Actinopolyspora biskrensis]|uniref:Uncharacterized protein n=1 Tax=Actinopolyspora biskrensis TaxID=1470178 RepID=A0A852Z511_9ACTN|nr:hypothetical protein [Actinopolyspora biskrensis]